MTTVQIEKALIARAVSLLTSAHVSTGLVWERHECVGKMIAALAASQVVEPAPLRPDLLEKLSYHKWEADDMTLDEVLEVLANGWKKVHGRTERQFLFQIVRLMASAPAAPAKPLSDEQRLEVINRAEKRFNSYIRLSWTDAIIEETEAAHGIKQPS